jgi:ribonuclease HI
MHTYIHARQTPKQWLHPADRTITTDTDNTQEDSTPQNIYTDGSKSEQGVGAGIVILRSGTPTVKLMYRLDTSCTNNQAEAFAIHVQTNLENEEHKVATVHTDSRTTLESLYNTDKHTFVTEEIRQKAKEMESRGWKTRFRWIKTPAGNSGNELADKLAKEASGKTEIPISCN